MGMVVPSFAARERIPVVNWRVLRDVTNGSPKSKFIAAFPIK
jgi:hypothetical protein